MSNAAAVAPAAGPAWRAVARSVRAPALVALVVALVWIAAAALFAGKHVLPYPWDLARQLATDWTLLWSNAAVTLEIAAKGFVAGVVVILPVAALCIAFPSVESVVVKVAVVVHVIPFIAIAPVLVVSLKGETFGITITALQVYFALLIGILLGLRSADRAALDVIDASGGGVWSRLRYVRFASAVPSLVSGLQIAVPAALLGSLISEFFGASKGLGAILVSAQEQLLTDRTWAIAAFIGALAAAGYGLITLIARVAVPWAGRGGAVGTTVAGTETARLSRTQTAVAALVSLVVLVGFWQSLRTLLHLDEYFTKSPLDVVRFLIDGNPHSGAPSSVFWGEFGTALRETAVDAAVGFLVGTVVAVAAAVVMVAFEGLGRAVMPLAVMLRSVPLIALAPVIVLVFGRGLLGVTVVVTLVTFFPTLVTVMMGLRGTPEGAVDVIRASGGSAFSAARRVRILYAIPSITASTRIAIPAAITGATLAEWLATGKGMGNLLIMAAVNADYFTLWAAGVLLVVLVLGLYSLIGWVDRMVLTRLGMSD